MPRVIFTESFLWRPTKAPSPQWHYRPDPAPRLVTEACAAAAIAAGKAHVSDLEG